MLNSLIANYLVIIVQGDCSLLGKDFTGILKEVFFWIQLAIPVIVVALCTADIAGAVVAQDESKMQKALGKVVKRVIIGVAIFFTPIVVGLLLDAASIGIGLCGVGG